MAIVTVRRQDGSEAGTLELSDSVFAREPHRSAMYAAVQQQLANARQGTHATKNRRLISGGGKKIWRQKGTGRARQGSIRAPHWYHGAVAHGPVPRSYRQRLPREVRRLAMRSALSEKLANGHLIVLDQISFSEPKTKAFVAMLDALGIAAARSTLFVSVTRDDNSYLSSRNLQQVGMLPAQGVDVVSVINCDWLVLTREAALHLEAILV
ncbi:MAG: 50S ribosomal protein L4 [Chloroflexi bacterium]|nr:50S ribosomal protein L4 [Chloroflexota bacterium]MCL5946696.1 50S ribosomal protein L4 [Chloroflexota bacterium]